MDPFVLREKFPSKHSSNLSSAALSSAILPGQGLENVGKILGKAGTRLHDIAMKRQASQNRLTALENTGRLGNELTKAYHEFSLEAEFNDETGEFKKLKLADGTEGTYDQVWNERAGTLRDRYLTGVPGIDTPFLERSASMFQRFAMDATEASIVHSQKKMANSLETIVTYGLNNVAELQKSVLEGQTDLTVDMEKMTRDHNADTGTIIADLDDSLLIPDVAKDKVFKGVAERYAEAYLDTLLRRNMVDSADKFISEGLNAGQFLKDTFFYISSKKLRLIRNKIAKTRATLVGGNGVQITHFGNAAITLFENFETDQGERSLATALDLIDKEYTNKDPNMGNFLKARLKATAVAATDYAKLSYKTLPESPFADHARLIEDFKDEYKDNEYSGAYAIKKLAALNTYSDTLRQAFLDSGSDYVLGHVKSVRDAAKDVLTEPDQRKKLGLNLKAIKLSIAAQLRFSPDNKPEILTLAQIEEANNMFNQEMSDAKAIPLTEFHKHVKDFFRHYGDFAGQVLNELKDPKEGRDNASSLPKLKSEIAIASIYGNTRVFNLIIGTTNNRTELRNFPWKESTLKDAEQKLVKAFSQFYQSQGYATFRDFQNTTMYNVALSYALGLTRQQGGLDPSNSKIINQTVKDLLTDKWEMHENSIGGLFGVFSHDKYLAIPKRDNEGNTFPHKIVSQALDNIRENPEFFNIPAEFTDEAGGKIIFKDQGIFINSGDGLGFHAAWYDIGTGRVTIIPNTYTIWEKFNEKEYKEAFTFEPTSVDELKAAVKLASEVEPKTLTQDALITQNTSGQSFDKGQPIPLHKPGPGTSKTDVVTGTRTTGTPTFTEWIMADKILEDIQQVDAALVETALKGVALGIKTVKDVKASVIKWAKNNKLDEIWLWEDVMEPFINYDPKSAAKRFQKQKKRENK